MKFNKATILLLILLSLSIAAASATSISDFNPPKGFDEGIGEVMDFDGDDYSIVLEDYDKEYDKDVFKGDAFNNVSIKENIAEYNDSFHDEVGAMELIKIGKTYYVVKCKYSEVDPSKISNCTKFLKEFNKKNDIKPEEINI